MAEQLSNNAVSNLSADISEFDTSLTVDDASAFPVSGDFRIICGDEIMLVTGVVGNTFTVTRALENTNDVAHAGGAVVAHVLTAGGLDALIDEAVAAGGGGATIGTGTVASLPGTPTDGDAYMPTDGIVIYRGNGSAWKAFGPLWPVEPPGASGWSWANQGAATISYTTGAAVLAAPLTAAGAHQWRYMYHTLPSAPYSIVFAFIPHLKPGSTSLCGVLLRDNADGDNARFQAESYYPSGNLVCEKWWTDDNFNTANVTTDIRGVAGTVLWVRFRDDSTTRYTDFSRDGINWWLHDSRSRTDWMAPNEVGFGVNARDTECAITVLHYKEN